MTKEQWGQIQVLLWSILLMVIGGFIIVLLGIVKLTNILMLK